MTTILTVLLCALLDAATASTNDSGVINLKLNPRHVELERRRRERKLSHRDNVYDYDHDHDYNDEEQPKGLYDNDFRYRRREEAIQIGALFEGYGTHYVDLWVGNPPQRQTVIVDTGSGITAFPCSGCRDCGAPDYHIDRLFVEEESTTFDKSTCSSASECIMDRSICNGSTCSVTMAYAEGSRWSAYEAVDQCYIAGPHETPLVSKKPKLEGDDLDPKHAADLAFDMTFGCQTVVTGLFKTQLADGIMGMSNQPSTYWSQMFAAEKMGSERQFALCFSRPPRVTREGTEAGAMTLGGVDDRLHDTPMVYTPRFDTGRRSFFSVNVRRVMLRDGKYGESAMSTDSNPNKGVVALDIDQGTVNRGGTIVDSGTTDTYFNSAIAVEFKAVFKKVSGYDHNNRAIKLNAKQFAAMPTILVQLESDDATNAEHDFYKTAGLAGALDPQHPSDVILAIPPSHYMEYNPAKEEYTSRFYTTEHSGNVLGANAIMGHNVFFDVEQTRIGWAESACDYTRTVENNGYDFEITGSLKEVEELSNNKKHNNNNDDNNNKPCESISSGAKCQTIEGCTWGWGKCTTMGDVDNSPPEDSEEDEQQTTENENDNEAPSGPEDLPPLDPAAEQEDSEKAASTNEMGEEEALNLVQDILSNPVAAAVYSSILLSILFCCYCLFCRRSYSEKHQYERANINPVSIELTNGGSSSRRSSKSFQDEPDDNGSDDDYDDEDNVVVCEGPPSSFRDDPEPEFEGDFA